MNAKKALQELVAGNQRFTANRMLTQNHLDRIKDTAPQQKPIAVVIACSDSRVVPEFIFDQGIGDLFVVRLAGNIIDDSVLGSVEYAVQQLGVRLIMVLGHTFCGAVNAAMDSTQPAGHLRTITDSIAPAVQTAKKHSGCSFRASVIQNTLLSAKRLRKSSTIIADYAKTKKLRITPAVYDISEGTVINVDTRSLITNTL